MKRSPLRLMLLSGVFMAFFALNAYSQQPAQQCWDFEEACGNPADAFFTGCIANAHAANGSPDTQSDNPNIVAFSGSKYAHMYAKQCYAGSGDPNIYHTEGIILRHNFVAGSPVKISFAVRSTGTSAPTETKVILVNDMPNFGGIGTPGLGCLNPLDIIRPIPTPSETIANFPKSAISGTQWQVKTINWTPQGDFNQIWFRPRAFTQNPTGEIIAHLYLDNVCIEDLCQSTSYAVSACHFSESENVFVSINGSPVVPSDWTLSSLYNCDPRKLKQSMFINWLPNNHSFNLPFNTGCYLLSGFHQVEGCPPQQFSFMINTDQGGVPICSSPCDDWHVSVNIKFCTELLIMAIPDSYFPSSTTYVFDLDGVTVQSGSNPAFSVPLSGPNKVAPGWHEICVTVNQNGCPPIQKCHQFYIDCFEGPGNDREDEAKEAPIKVSNPASGTIWLSKPIGDGRANLYSMQGSLVKSFALDGTDRLDVAELVTGQYILAIQSQSLSVSKKVFIQNQR